VLLSAALIVRDEEPVLDECLASIRSVVDEIVVVDTGSADRSLEIAERHGAHVIDHPWQDDFAEARNVALEAAAGDWILYIDADERLANGDRGKVEQLLAGANEVAFRLLLRPDSISTPYLEYRLWRHDRRIRFAGRIHEKVVPAIHAVSAADGRPIGDCDLLLTHVGYEGDQTRKHRRNLPLLRAQLEEEPDNLFNRHHLARVLRGLGEDDEAEPVLVGAVELARARPFDGAGVLVFTDLIRLRRDRGGDPDELLAEARRLYPTNKLLWWLHGTARLESGRPLEALDAADLLLAVDQETLPLDGPAYDERIFGEFAYELRGIALFRLERYAEAADSFSEALRLAPDNLAYRAKHEVAVGRTRAGRASGAD
jgi:glycosyltransferase involved in cell wall biosynthesis